MFILGLVRRRLVLLGCKMTCRLLCNTSRQTGLRCLSKLESLVIVWLLLIKTFICRISEETPCIIRMQNAPFALITSNPPPPTSPGRKEQTIEDNLVLLTELAMIFGHPKEFQN